MAFDVDGLLHLWTSPLPPPGEAEAAFRTFYTDPVRVNGTLFTASDLVARAAAMQATFEDPEREVLDLVETGDKVALAFRMRGKQVGPLATSAGQLPPTGRLLDLRIIDILTITDGRISNVWMTADELGALNALGAVTLIQPT
ncbi:ester cyclase [Nonomuraea sp. NPDC050786]|uniref:ester cyclase n=1 Tax=Nonomuraea sp. NPDC050786 TaxID=3154840 RepID=UPI003403ED22